jgi:hypothetical protein
VLVAGGLSTWEVAACLGTPLRKYVATSLTRSQPWARSKLEAVVLAFRRGLIDPPAR